MPVSTHAEPTKCAQNKWIKWTQRRSRGAIIHCCPYRKMMCAGMNWWVSVWPSVPLQVSHPGKSGVFPSGWIFLMWVLVSNTCTRSCVMKMLQIPGGHGEHNSGSVQHLIIWPHLLSSHFLDTIGSFWQTGMLFFNLLLSYPNEINCFIVFIKVWTRCGIKGTSMVLQRKPLWKWKHTNTERQKIPSSPIFLLFQSTLG